MKNFIFRILILITMALLSLSCSQDETDKPIGEDEPITVSFEIISPDLVKSSVSLKNASENGQEEMMMRYTVAAYKSSDVHTYLDGSDQAPQPVRLTETNAPFATTGSPVGLSLNLLPGEYIFVVWADYGAAKYNISDLTDIRFATGNDQSANPANEAFSAVSSPVKISLNVTKVQIILKRSVAQLDIITLDVVEFLAGNNTFEKGVFTFQNTYPSFDAIKQKPEAPAGYERNYIRQLTTVTLPSNSSSHTLYSELLFASPEANTTYISLTTDILVSGTNVKNKKNVVIQANRKTRAEGGLLTTNHE